MATAECQIFRLPDQFVALETAIEAVDDQNFLDLVITPMGDAGKMNAVFIHKDGAVTNNLVVKVQRLNPAGLAALETYIETLDDAKILKTVLTPRDAVGMSYAIVVSQT